MPDNKHIFFGAWFLLCCIPMLTHSQAGSPYTRFGLGNIFNPAVSANQGMGNITAAYRDPYHINFNNPASYASLALTTFEIGAFVKGLNIRSASTNLNTVNGFINQVSFGFPLIKDKWGAGVGLLPFSFSDYNFELSIDNEQTGNFTKRFVGDGQLYQAYVGTGFSISGFSLGINGRFLFGNINSTQSTVFSDNGGVDVQNISTLRPSGFMYNIGAQYDKTFRNDYNIVIGLQGTHGVNVRTFLDQIWRTGRQDGSVFSANDTIRNIAGQRSTIKMPAMFSTGITAGKGSFWKVGVDFQWQQWVAFASPLDNTSPLANSWRISLGSEVFPAGGTGERRRYWSKISYRMGAYYGLSHLILRNRHLPVYGLTFGLGLPIKIRQVLSRINLSLELARRGVLQEGLFRESSVQFTIAYTINSRWFVRRKIN